MERQGKRCAEFEVNEPYASDVSEGKNNPIYMAHAYHTKVPHPAIMRYILHYTQPGDIVYDGFCGTGMTGVAAQLCGSQKDVLALNEKDVKDAMREVRIALLEADVNYRVVKDFNKVIFTLNALGFACVFR